MSKEKIKFEHFKNIEELIKHLEMWYEEDDYYCYDRYFHLEDARKMGIYIYEQNKRIEELCLEIEKLNNIINELKERSLQYSEEIDRLLDIKEKVREYIEKASYFQGNKILEEKELLEILDKENNNG